MGLSGARARVGRLRRVRIPLRRIWRAFPELDVYNDSECRQFLRVARRRAPWRHFHAFLILAVFFFGVIGCVVLSTVLLTYSMRGMKNSAQLMAMNAALVAGMVALPSLATMILRDWLLRRRVRFVLRDSGSCPQCRYSLVGLVIPESLQVSCPECGFVCRVDESLSVLARGNENSLSADAAGGARIGVERRVVMARPPYWTRERRRRWRRTATLVVVLLMVLLGTPLGIYEYRIRAQAAQAQRDIPTAADLAALTERHRPNIAVVADPRAHMMIEQLHAQMNEIDERVWPSSERMQGSWPGFELVLAPSEEAAEDERNAVTERDSLDAAQRLLTAYREAGVIDDLLAIRGAPVEVRKVPGAPGQFLNITLPHLSAARLQARVMGAVMLLAIERGDTAAAVEALETMIALGRACGDQPFLIEVLVGWAIDNMTADRVQRWLASNPSTGELDAIERVWQSRDPAASAAFAIDIETMCQKAFLASFFADPSMTRLAPIWGIGGAFARVAGQPLRTPGNWEGNRNTIEASRARATAAIALEPWQRASPGAVPPPPDFVDAGLAQILTPALDSFTRAADSRRAAERVFRVSIALERWRLDHGDYPEALDQLVPQWLTAVPLDPWSGKPLGYRRVDRATDPFGRGFILYSLGPHGDDDGGRETEAHPAKYDRERRPPESVPRGYDAQLNKFAPIPRAAQPSNSDANVSPARD